MRSILAGMNQTEGALVERASAWGCRTGLLESLTSTGGAAAASCVAVGDEAGSILLTLARDGMVVSRIKLTPGTRVGKLPRSIRPVLADLPANATTQQVWERTLQAAETYTKVGIADLINRTPAGHLTGLRDESASATPEEEPTLLDRNSPALAERIRRSDPATQAGLAYHLTRALVREAGLREIPALVGPCDRLEARITPYRLLPAEVFELNVLFDQAGKWQLKAITDPESFGALEGSYLNQKAHAGEALLNLERTDVAQAAPRCVNAALAGFKATNETRGLYFVEDSRGRRIDPSRSDPGREPVARDFVTALLDSPLDTWDSLAASLPAPLTEAARRRFIQDDQERQQRGEFQSYKIL